jgi:tetratricopeptide (TPR) repeat protein
VLNLQSEVAGRIARAVNVALSPASQARLQRDRPVNPDAYIPYLRGRFAWNQRTQAGFESALRFFEQAVAADPQYAAAYTGLADTYSFLGAYEGASREGLKKASAAARRAVELDGNLAEAHTSLAWMRFRAGWDWAGAEASFRRAIELNPGYATARQWYASFLSTLGRHSEAVPEARHALDIDPLSPVMHRTLAVVYLTARRFDEAEVSAREALAIDPQVPAAHLTLARILCAKGDAPGAVLAAEQVPPPSRNTDFAAYMGYFHARAGHKAQAQEVLVRLRREASEGRATAHSRALVYTGLGEIEAALGALEEAVKERSPFVLGLKTHPVLDPLRAEARFQALIQAVGLPQ